VTTYSVIQTNHEGTPMIVNQRFQCPHLVGTIMSITKLSDGAARVTVRTETGEDALIDVAGITVAIVEIP